MPEPRLVAENKGYMGMTNTSCPFFPCHKLDDFIYPDQFNCLFCTCPLYWLECPGNYSIIIDANGVKRKDCSNCNLPHDGFERSWKIMNLSKFQKIPVIWKNISEV